MSRQSASRQMRLSSAMSLSMRAGVNFTSASGQKPIISIDIFLSIGLDLYAGNKGAAF